MKATIATAIHGEDEFMKYVQNPDQFHIKQEIEVCQSIEHIYMFFDPKNITAQ